MVTTQGRALLASAATATLVAAQGSDPGGENTFTNTNGGLPWTQAIAMAQQIVSQMTPEEQNNLTFGITPDNGCSGVSGAAPRFNYSGFCLSDSGNGVRGTDLVTGFASGVSTAASWNVDLARTRAVFMGAEFKRKGSHVVNGPVVGPIGRIALDGRAWEGLGVDPYLNGQLAAVSVEGLQQSVITAVKHYIGNEQETDRNPPNALAVSADFDDQTLHELYLWPFQDAVRAGAGSIMCSYNRLNGTYACANDYTLNTVLKDELAFPGFVLSDWTAQHDGSPSANAGLDMAMPDSVYWDNSQLVTATQNGSIVNDRLADMATRILASWYHVFNGPAGDIPLGIGLPLDQTAPHDLIEARDPASKASTLQSAIEGHVLLKNTNNALPLNKPKFLSLFGYDATVAPVNNPNSAGFSIYNFGLQSVNTTIQTILGAFLGTSSATVPETAVLGTWLGGGGSGAITASYWSDPYSAMQQQAYEDDTFLRWDFQSTSPDVSVASDACLVFINEGASEGFDRPGLADPDSDTLVNNVADKCANTIVVIHNVWIRTVESWFDHPNVTALVFAHLPGQDSGRALVEVLYGKQSPSGRLPYTVAKSAFDYGPLLNPCVPAQGDADPQCYFNEGTNIDYRYFLAHDIVPRFPFGYGLTYSNFSYSEFSAGWKAGVPPVSPPNPTVVAPGGITSLFDTVATATFTLQNTGAVEATEVAQLYVQFPGEDKVRQLRGFSKENLQPGKSKTVNLDLTRRDLSRWNVVSRMWEVQKGTYTVYLGQDVLNAAGRSVTLECQ